MAEAVEAEYLEPNSFASNPLSRFRLSDIQMSNGGTIFTLGIVIGVAVTFFGIYIIRKKF
ncbi:hypothetical protein EBZ80_07085 [bacterium]|nr:hypothetical protein [bacterium]